MLLQEQTRLGLEILLPQLYKRCTRARAGWSKHPMALLEKACTLCYASTASLPCSTLLALRKRPAGSFNRLDPSQTLWKIKSNASSNSARTWDFVIQLQIARCLQPMNIRGSYAELCVLYSFFEDLSLFIVSKPVALSMQLHGNHFRGRQVLGEISIRSIRAQPSCFDLHAELPYLRLWTSSRGQSRLSFVRGQNLLHQI